MDLTKIMERLNSFPAQGITYYNGEGQLEFKAYPAVRADVENAITQLRAWGVEAGMHVGILSTNWYEFVLYDIALMELRCTSLVFPEEFGNKTNRQFIEDYNLNLLLLAKRDTWPTTNAGQWTAYIDADNPPDTRARSVSRSEKEDYTPSIAFSSGSTGKIKGMTFDPRGCEGWLEEFYERFEINNRDSLLTFLPLSSIQQRILIYATIFYGIDCCLINPAQLFTALKDYKPTLFIAPPLLYERVHNQFVKTVDGMPASKRSLVNLMRSAARIAPAESLRKRLRQICYGKIYSTFGGRMRVMWTGMAPIKRSTLDFFAETRLPLFEAYGQTECGLIATNSPMNNRLGSVGKPLEAAGVSLADDGEVIVHQKYLQTKGYVFNDATEPSPYIDAQTLATGDVGRFDEDGYLYLLGRKKAHIATAQGYKVHPELVEAHINVCPDVAQSVVFGNGLPYLVALISIDKDKDADAQQRIERHIAQLNQKLPPVGRIQKLHFTREQFTTDNGLLTRNLKLHRTPIFNRFAADLLSEGRPAETAGALHEEPRTETERRLADIWRDVLNVKKIGRQDEFLALGGDSLLATQVLSRVRDNFKIDLPLATFFETGKLSELAHRIDDFIRTQTAPSDTRIQRAPRDGELPLSYAQQRLWFLRQLEPNNTSYNEASAVRLSGVLDLHALERAFEQIIARHEILRTTFHSIDGRPFQVVNPTTSFSIRRIEVPSTNGVRNAEVQRIISEMARVPFDFERGPLMHVSLLSSSSTPSEHVMVLLMHHIISDGWSQGVLVREVAWLYQSFIEGRPAKMPELEIQYIDFAVWQRQWLQGETIDRLLHYWKQQLAGAPPVLELPADRPHALEQTHTGGVIHFRVDPAVADRLRTMCRDQNVTLFMLLLAAFQVQLSRYTSQNDICVGTPIANRNRAEIEPLIGFFVNTLVLRAQLSGDPTFSELLDRVRKVTLGAYEHQDIPFERIVEELQPDRRLSRTPLFQVMFILQNAPLAALELPGLKLSYLDVESVTTKFDLTLSYREADGQLNGMFVYDRDLFDTSTVERMIEHCNTLLSSIASDPSRRISELPLLGEAERGRLVHGLNETRVPLGPTRCVHHLFEEQVARTPEHTAVVDERNRLSYRELDTRANQLAHRLRKLGVGPEVRVGILLQRSVEGMIAVFGVLKAGGAYVPLEPMHPVDRWQRIIDDAGVAVVVSEQRFAALLPADAARFVLLDADDDALARESTEPVAPMAVPQNLAYVIYTSGSTGQPKGVAVEHQQLYNYLRGIEFRLELEPASSYAAVSTLAADLGHTIIFGALCTGKGATLHLISQERAGDAEALTNYVLSHQIDYLKIVPSHLRALLEAGGQVIPRRGIILGGEAFTLDLAHAIAGTAPEIAIFNHYGPTETTVGALTHRVSSDEPLTRSGTVPLGRPLPNTRLYVLDRRLEPVPAGVAGELFIGGASVTRGYLNAPAATAEKFISDPFSDESGARMYRTGDLVRYIAEGQVEFLGRVDDQVKIRGYRLEPVEVEEALRRHKSVRAAVVTAYGENGADKRLAAYVTALPGTELTTSELREFARDRLPDFMIPSVWLLLDELPLTPNGKIDRRALPSPEDLRPQTEMTYVAPRTVDEEILAQVWGEILRLERVGINDNFFDVGGHSLLATQLVSHIRKRLDVEMPLRVIFEEPTIAGQAAGIEALRWSKQDLKAVAAAAGGEREVGEL